MALKSSAAAIPLDNLALGVSIIALLVLLPALFNPRKFREAVEEFLDSGNTVLRLASFANLILAFLILNTYWKINLRSPRTFMSAIAYLLLLRSIVWMWFPGFARTRMKKVLHSRVGFPIMVVLMLAFFLGFGYLGIWVYQ